jgi:SAM-dependent methyltransferase
MTSFGNDITEQDRERGTPGWWNNRYLNGDIPWDTGIVPPELHEVVESGLLVPGWALDLGCGSGLNSRYLAQHGFRVVGIDLALQALSRGSAAARAAALPAYCCMADVTAPPLGQLKATFALDIGCLHGVARARRAGYVEALARLLDGGAYYLLYAFAPRLDDEAGPTGVGADAMHLFGPHFSLLWARHGRDGERLASWYLLQRH